METTKSIYDKNGKTIQIGNTINVAGTAMVSTEYGDFNPSIIEVVNPKAWEV
jgi:DNA-binding XRE family transcriptional regulator